MNLPKDHNLVNLERSSRIFEQTLMKLKDEPVLIEKLEHVVDTYENQLKNYFERQEQLMFHLISEEINFKKELNRLVLFQK